METAAWRWVGRTHPCTPPRTWIAVTADAHCSYASATSRSRGVSGILKSTKALDSIDSRVSHRVSTQVTSPARALAAKRPHNGGVTKCARVSTVTTCKPSGMVWALRACRPAPLITTGTGGAGW